MDNRYNYDDPWNSGIYETGRTRPRKRRLGCLTSLLVLITIPVGLISFLGFLNTTWTSQAPSEDTQLSWETLPSETAVCDTDFLVEGETLCFSTEPVELNTSPQSVPNIPQDQCSLQY